MDEPNHKVDTLAASEMAVEAVMLSAACLIAGTLAAVLCDVLMSLYLPASRHVVFLVFMAGYATHTIYHLMRKLIEADEMYSTVFTQMSAEQKKCEREVSQLTGFGVLALGIFVFLIAAEMGSFPFLQIDQWKNCDYLGFYITCIGLITAFWLMLIGMARAFIAYLPVTTPAA